MTIFKTATFSWPLQKWTYEIIDTDEETSLSMQECQHKFNTKYRIIDKFERVVAKSDSLAEINDDWTLLINLVSSMLESRNDKHNVSDEVMECASGICFRLLEKGTKPDLIPYYEAGKIQAGDHLVAKKKIPLPMFVTGFYHHAIYAGGGSILHFTGDSPSDATVRLTKLDEFLKNASRAYIIRHKWKFNTNTILRRGFGMLGDGGYSLLNWNCEHYVNYCITGIKRCYQVKKQLISNFWQTQFNLVFLFLSGIVLSIKRCIVNSRHGTEKDMMKRIEEQFVN